MYPSTPFLICYNITYDIFFICRSQSRFIFLKISNDMQVIDFFAPPEILPVTRS